MKRRYRTLPIHPTALDHILRKCFDLPEDAKVINVIFKPESDTLEVKLYSEDYDEVPSGSVPEWIDINRAWKKDES